MLKNINTHIHPFIALICLFFVFVMGVSNLKTDPIENDEFRTLNHIEPVWLTTTRTVQETVQSVASLSPQHGPLYFVVLNVWHKLAGSDLFSLRLLSTFLGVLSIAMLYRLATITGRRDDGAAAALALSFLAFYSFHVHYLRMYTLLSFACAVVIWSYWAVRFGRSQSRWTWILLFAATALMPYIHYMGSLILLAIGIYHLLLTRRDKRWWQILALMALAGLMFLPWLPFVISGLAEHRLDATATRLTLMDAIRAILSVSSNGILLLPPFVAGLALVKLRRLNDADKYLAFVAMLTAAMLFVLNEFVPIFIANRLRYSLIMVVPYCCVAVIVLRMLPAWRLVRIPLLVIWCMSFYHYLGTEDYAIFTNILQHETEKIPNYQDFVYESDQLPGHNELILSFHPDMMLSSNKTLSYYRKVISNWSYIVHITYDANGDLVIQSGHSKYDSLDAIAGNSRAIWVLHNPAQTDLDSMPVFRDWFLQNFRVCRRFLDRETSAIDYYLKLDLPCELVVEPLPVGIRYDNGMELANTVVEHADRELTVYLWWGHTIGKDYSLSLQIFDLTMTKVRQLDWVISGEPIDDFSFDLTELSPGEYSVELIVYNFETKASEAGILIGSQERFERSVTLTRLSLDEQT